MVYEDKLRNVSVLGAAGKMGSGILLLTAMEMVRLKLLSHNSERTFVLNAIDTSDQALADLIIYVRDQARRFAERKIVQLRKSYSNDAELVDNEDIINRYAEDVVGVIRPATRIESAFDSYVVFEAVSEKPKLKIELFKTIDQHNKNQVWFFSNTSAIPIGWLDEQSGLEGRIMGVHFYNPPAVQKLLEVVKTDTTRPELSYFVADFLKNLQKEAVPAYDVAGFIGNGYFMRDILFAESMMSELMKECSFTESLFMVNKISQDFLLRPMGIFQLADYVGIDVVQFIMSVMKHHSGREKMHSELIDQYILSGIKGGQNADGSQKNGFFRYNKAKIESIYDPGKKRYIAIEEISHKCGEYLGDLPLSHTPWKNLVRNPDKQEILKRYFHELRSMNTTGAKWALAYLVRFKEIGLNLVKEQVAFRFEDVNAVLTKGFHHAYGPVNDNF